MGPREFISFILKFKNLNKFPNAASWPSTISFDRSFWQKVSLVKEFTSKNKHEYEISVFYYGNETYISEPTKGTEHNVTSDHQMQVEHKQISQDRVERIVTIDRKVAEKKQIKIKDIKKKPAGFLFTLHTHPKYTTGSEDDRYSFFSDVDINSLLRSNSYMLGLVTDNFWLVGRTSDSIENLGDVGQEFIYKISYDIYHGGQHLPTYINELKRWGLVFYCGKIGDTIKKL